MIVFKNYQYVSNSYSDFAVKLINKTRRYLKKIFDKYINLLKNYYIFNVNFVLDLYSRSFHKNNNL